MESFLELLAKHDFLHGIEATHIQFLAEIAEMVTFESGDFAFRQGEQADFFYLIQNGKIEVEAFSGAAGPVVIQTLSEGQLLGWSWLIAPYQWRSDARAIERTTAIRIDGRRLRDRCEEDHDLGYILFKRFLTVLALRLEAARLQLVETYAAHS